MNAASQTTPQKAPPAIKVTPPTPMSVTVVGGTDNEPPLLRKIRAIVTENVIYGTTKLSLKTGTSFETRGEVAAWLVKTGRAV